LNVDFQECEKLYRGIKRKPKFIKRDNTITRNAFTYTGKASNGCSVSRQKDRSNNEAIKHTLNWLGEYADEVVSIKYKLCHEGEIYVVSTPSLSNKYHEELFQDKEKEKLNDEQLDFLAENCILEINDGKE
jgi:hypothetical protein